jgi:hypothetical protein
MTTAYSSHGNFVFDNLTGKVLKNNLKSEFGQMPLTVDIDEYKSYYGYPMQNDVDVLDIGYWTLDGIYTPPIYEWREELKQLKLDTL